MSAVMWAINRKCLLHKSRRLIRAAESMQSYLPARNAACAVSYANYATRSTSPDCLRVCVCVCGVSMAHSSACACVCVFGGVIRQQVGQRQSKPEIPRNGNQIVLWPCLSFVFLSFTSVGVTRNYFFLPSHWIECIYYYASVWAILK